uniref:PPM-type phosphatase domain-containing protein n=1 Tax=Meloidogyne hapla TaxID=6305 RepID=A0A1I8C142_MELHA
MGAFLDKPKTEKTDDIGVGRDYRYVVASMQGWRIVMRDAHHVKISIGDDPPVKVKQVLNSNGQKITEKSKLLIKEGMKSAFLQLDDSMKNLFGGIENKESGTTAICAILTPDYIFFANLGDSRGILSRKSDNIFSTEDHKPYMKKERIRIARAGGSVILNKLNGNLALFVTEQLVSPEPDIYIIERNKGDDEFLVLASDGIYDVLENEELCRLVRSRLTVTEDLKHASNQVLDVCLSKGSRDNMTMIMVVFDAAPKVKNEAVELENVWLESVDKRLKELIDSKHDGADDADSITLILKQEGFDDNSPSTCDIHLARSLIDRVLEENKLDESQQRQQSQQHQEANNK